MLQVVSKITYKFATTSIYILFSFIADQVLNRNDFGKFSVIIALQILIFHLSDIINSKYLLGKFSNEDSQNSLKLIFNLKAKWSLLLVSLFSISFYFYQVPIKLIVLLILINYIQILSSTLATYIFSNEKSYKLLISNLVGSVSCFVYLILNFKFTQFFDVSILIVSILIYRSTELFFLLFAHHKSIKFLRIGINWQVLIESYPFYLQIVLSIISAKVFVLYLPFILNYQDISLIATVDYILSVPIFLISIIAMSTYSNLFKFDSESKSFPKYYNRTIREFYLKGFGIAGLSLIIEIAYIIIYKSEILNLVIFVVIQNILIVLTTIQGYILFYWKKNLLVLIISILTLVFKTILIFPLTQNLGVYGYFLSIFIIETIFSLFILYKVHLIKRQKIQNESAIPN